MKTRLSWLLVLGLMLGMTTAGDATTILFEVMNLGGTRYEYAYEVTNDTLTFAIEEFTIFFAFGLYDNLSVTTPVAGWDEIVVNPDLILGTPDDGFYDAVALGAGIAPGVSLSGFSVSFDWLGTGTPGAQHFDVVDPLTLDVRDSGITGVPEPGTLVLVSVGLLGLVCFLKRVRQER